MTTEQETVYRRLRSDIPDRELRDIYTPTRGEMELLGTRANHRVAGSAPNEGDGLIGLPGKRRFLA
jgi:hypothetical protein